MRRVSRHTAFLLLVGCMACRGDDPGSASADDSTSGAGSSGSGAGAGGSGAGSGGSGAGGTGGAGGGSASGVLDPTFGTNGCARIDLGGGDGAIAAGVQKDGSIVLAGIARGLRAFGVLRLTPDGALDTTFGDQGVTVVDLIKDNYYHEAVYDLAVGADDSILVVGSLSDSGIGVAVRLTSAGAPDIGFGPNGVAQLDPWFGGSKDVWNELFAVRAAPDGTFYAAGGASFSSSKNGYTLARFGATGQIPFTGGGVGADDVDNGTLLFSTREHAQALALQQDGKLVTTSFSDQVGFLISRHQQSGALDGSFGDAGRTGHCDGQSAYCSPTSIAVAPDGGILVYGDMNGGSGVVRLKADGSVDASFGANGDFVTQQLQSGGSMQVVVQPDGKPILVGSNGNHFAAIRLGVDGKPDTGFGDAGFVRVQSENGQLGDVVLQQDGRIILAGTFPSADGGDVGVCRLLP